MGMSKLGVFVRLYTSKLYFTENRSDNCVSFSRDTSARRCQDCRNMLRWPEVKLVSKLSPVAIAPFKSPGLSSGSVKQDALRAGALGLLPTAPVSALCGVQPGA